MATTVCVMSVFGNIEQLAKASSLPDNIDVGVRFPDPAVEILQAYLDNETPGRILYYSRGYKPPKNLFCSPASKGN